MITGRLSGFERHLTVLFLALLVAGCTTTSVLRATPFKIPSDRFAAIIIEEKSGQVLYQIRPDAIRFPASLTKMMTVYLALEAIESGKINFSDWLKVSARAARQGGTTGAGRAP